MLTYSFADLGSDSLYEHLYKCIKNDILNGVLTIGEKLPSKRNFAKNLNISTITVENAYAQLMAEGYIYSLPKKGYFVADISTSVLENTTNTFFPATDAPVTEVPVTQKPYFADFVSNSITADNFPFSIWAKIIREVISEECDALMTNPPAGGIPELRNAIAQYLFQFRGMKVDPAQIIIGAGTEYLYGLLIQLLGNNNTFGVEDPGYRKIAQIYNSHRANCKHIPLDNYGVELGVLEESGADIIHISPSHHYPTGIVTPISRRYELLGWASKSSSRYIIEDDYDCEFRLQGKPIPSLQSIDVMEKVIYINTFSKSLASTIRISYMVLPHHLLERFYRQLGFYSCTVSNFEQYTLAHFISQGYFEKHINRTRNFYKTQRDTLLNCIKNSPLASRSTIMEEDAGLHFLLKLDTKLSDEDLIEKAKQAGLHIACLSKYYYNPQKNMEHTLVMNYSGLEPEKIPEAVHRLCACLDLA
ncbi:MAG: PLP-dependent aminotransferase family protein [Clostridiales bacterium]|nr:PLP-dependent aminotransferase family protein [Clostridiales bacterium]